MVPPWVRPYASLHVLPERSTCEAISWTERTENDFQRLAVSNPRARLLEMWVHRSPGNHNLGSVGEPRHDLRELGSDGSNTHGAIDAATVDEFFDIGVRPARVHRVGWDAQHVGLLCQYDGRLRGKTGIDTRRFPVDHDGDRCRFGSGLVRRDDPDRAHFPVERRVSRYRKLDRIADAESGGARAVHLRLGDEGTAAVDHDGSAGWFCGRREFRGRGADVHSGRDLDTLDLPAIGAVRRSSLRLSFWDWIFASSWATFWAST